MQKVERHQKPGVKNAEMEIDGERGCKREREREREREKFYYSQTLMVISQLH